MYDAILIPTDGRENTERAIDEAIELSRVHDATLHALYVVNSSAIAPGIDFDDLEEVGSEAVEYVTGRAAEAGVTDVETAVTHGLRHQAILDYAANNGIELIVMGRQRLLERLFRGGTSDRVSEKAPVPVLVVEGRR